jgi:hypothetical protein
MKRNAKLNRELVVQNGLGLRKRLLRRKLRRKHVCKLRKIGVMRWSRNWH